MILFDTQFERTHTDFGVTQQKRVSYITRGLQKLINSKLKYFDFFFNFNPFVRLYSLIFAKNFYRRWFFCNKQAFEKVVWYALNILTAFFSGHLEAYS